jgi:hypothetical protein
MSKSVREFRASIFFKKIRQLEKDARLYEKMKTEGKDTEVDV